MIKRSELDRIDFSDVTTGERLDPITPGEILKAEFLEPMGITPYKLAQAIEVPQTRISEIINKGRSITADTDLRLCKFFKLGEGFFLRLQEHHDLEVARVKLADTLAHIPTYEEILAA